MSPIPIASVTRAPQPSSSAARNAGSPPPGSPATSTRSTLDARRSIPRSSVHSTRCAAYDGVSTAASGRSTSIARTSRSVFPVPKGMWQRPIRSNAAERGARYERAGVVGRDDPLPGGDAGRRVASCRAGHPVVEIAGGERDVARRARRPARRVDPDDLVAVDAEMRAERVVRSARLAQLALLGERQRRDLGEPAGVRRPSTPAAPSFAPVERRALDQVRDLCSVGVVVEGALPSHGSVSTSGSSITASRVEART